MKQYFAKFSNNIDKNEQNPLNHPVPQVQQKLNVWCGRSD